MSGQIPGPGGAPRRGRWLERPQTAPLRKALFRVHLWIGIGTGLYVVVISVSGSIAVFRREAARWLLAPERGGGDPFPPAMRAMEWFVDLHDNLLAGETGRLVNGAGGILVTLLVLSGAVIWWPGRARWRRSLWVPRPAMTRRFAWHLHSALGFWGLVLLLGWAVTGVYFAFPAPFDGLLDRFDPDPNDFERPGEGVLLQLIELHFGRFGGLSIRVLWVVLGLLPAALFVTGFIVWLRRLRRRETGP